MCAIYMKRRMKARTDPSRKNVSMQIMGGDPDSLETYKAQFFDEEPLRMNLKGSVTNSLPRPSIYLCIYAFMHYSGVAARSIDSVHPRSIPKF